VTQQVVRTGQLVGQYRVIESGLSITDKVVVGGIQRAIPGAKVEPEQAPAAPAAAASSAATPAAGASPAAPAGAATPAKP